MAEKCIFCEMSNDTGPVFWRNSYFMANLDRFPVSPGHVEIFPRRHLADMMGLSETEWIVLRPSIKAVIQEIEKTNLKKVYEEMLQSPLSEISDWFCRTALNHPKIGATPDGYNHGVNDGHAAGRTIDHVHWHIIPRFAGDMVDPRGGVRYVIPERGNYKIPR